MSRSRLSLAALVALSLALGACADVTAPKQECQITQGAHDCPAPTTP